MTEGERSELPPDESDVETLCRNIDKPIAGLRSEVGAIGEDLTRMGHLYPVMCPVINDIKQRLMAMTTHVKSLEALVEARRVAGKEKPKTKQDRPADYELMQFAARASAPAMTKETRQQMLRTLHAAGDHSLDDEEVQP